MIVYKQHMHNVYICTERKLKSLTYTHHDNQTQQHIYLHPIHLEIKKNFLSISNLNFLTDFKSPLYIVAVKKESRYGSSNTLS